MARGKGTDKLSDVDKLFVLTYLANGQNATDAYAQTHPNAKRTTCAAEGYKILRKPEIKRAIDAELKRRGARLRMTGEEALDRVSEIAAADISELYDNDGRLLPIKKWPAAHRRAVKSIRPGQFGRTIVFHDQLGALLTLAKADGTLKDVKEVKLSLADLLDD